MLPADELESGVYELWTGTSLLKNTPKIIHRILADRLADIITALVVHCTERIRIEFLIFPYTYLRMPVTESQRLLSP